MIVTQTFTNILGFNVLQVKLKQSIDNVKTVAFHIENPLPRDVQLGTFPNILGNVSLCLNNGHDVVVSDYLLFNFFNEKQTFPILKNCIDLPVSCSLRENTFLRLVLKPDIIFTNYVNNIGIKQTKTNFGITVILSN